MAQYSASLAEYSVEFDSRYDETSDKAGLQLNDVGKFFLWFLGSGLASKTVDDIKLQVNGDFTRFNDARALALRATPNKENHADIFYDEDTWWDDSGGHYYQEYDDAEDNVDYGGYDWWYGYEDEGDGEWIYEYDDGQEQEWQGYGEDGDAAWSFPILLQLTMVVVPPMQATTRSRSSTKEKERAATTAVSTVAASRKWPETVP